MRTFIAMLGTSFLWFAFGVFCGFAWYHHDGVPIIIDMRANELGLMQYSAAEDKMIPKPEYFWTLTYLKTGKMR